MKPSSQPPGTPSKLSDSVHHQLNMYGLAASAGVGLLALAQPAEAKVVYTRTHHVVGPNHDYVIYLNHDGIGDFTISNWYGCSDYGCAGDELAAVPAKGNTAAGNQFHQAFALYRGAVIGFKRFHFSGQSMALAGEGFPLGYWYNVRNRYLGLKFQIKGKTHYGWARLNVTVRQGLRITATLTGYAYETIPNKAIIAGKTKGPDVINVQPGSLGHLAAGTSAIPAWRSGK
jgi:hypothetical protein